MEEQVPVSTCILSRHWYIYIKHCYYTGLYVVLCDDFLCRSNQHDFFSKQFRLQFLMTYFAPSDYRHAPFISKGHYHCRNSQTLHVINKAYCPCQLLEGVTLGGRVTFPAAKFQFLLKFFANVVTVMPLSSLQP